MASAPHPFAAMADRHLALQVHHLALAAHHETLGQHEIGGLHRSIAQHHVGMSGALAGLVPGAGIAPMQPPQVSIPKPPKMQAASAGHYMGNVDTTNSAGTDAGM